MAPDFSEALRAFAARLNSELPGWEAGDDRLVGPNGRLVLFDQRDADAGERHVDVAVRLNQDDPRTELWDCASGMGHTHAERMQMAAGLWIATTGKAAFEFWYSGQGDYADHFRGTDPDGFPGWHAIHSPVVRWGSPDSAAAIVAWAREHLMLRGLAGVFGKQLATGRPHGFKVFLGGLGAVEVRLDGEAHDAATDFVASLDWPRLEPEGFIRWYVILAHPEPF